MQWWKELKEFIGINQISYAQNEKYDEREERRNIPNILLIF